MAAYVLGKTRTRICSLKTLRDKDDYIVWWYGGIKKNPKAESVPNVVVFFRRINRNGPYGGFTEMQNVRLTLLGLLRIGSVWSRGVSKSEVIYPIETFDLSFSENIGWKIVSPRQSMQNGEQSPISQKDYPLSYDTRDRNWLIDFTLKDGRNLLVPCLEYFSSCYAHSDEVRRVLTTYPWNEVQRRFYAPLNMPVMPDKWFVKLTSRMINDDVKLLAHILYDDYARQTARDIYSQLEASFIESDNVAFIKIKPWFQGPARMRLTGLWINDGRTFLGLQVLGSSDPAGVPILRSRDRQNKLSNVDGKNLEIVPGRPIGVLNKLPDIINLTGDDEPDHGEPSVEVEDRRFVVLGKPRTVIDVKEKDLQSQTFYKNWIKDSNVDTFATGERYGSGKGIGTALIRSRIIMESHGVLRDMWNAILHLKQKHPDIVESINWFTFEDGFCENTEPQLIALTPFSDDDDDNVTTEMRNWLFFDVPGKVPRGILVVRIVMSDNDIYIVEIQRRIVKKKEEPLRGFVFTLDSQQQFVPYLRSLLSDVRREVGIVERLIGGCPGKADVFKHVPAAYERIPCEAAVKNAFRKMGVTF